MAKLVLAIDDDKSVHHIIEESLAGFCKVIHAKNGDEAIKLAHQHHPDIILLDVEIQGKSGYEVCKSIKAATQDIPIMFLSSKVGQAERIKGFSAGAADYILKPFNAQELMARIKVLYQYRQQCAKLRHDIVKANNTVEIAMTEAGDMGRIMRYVCQSYHADNLALLSHYFLAFFTPFHLNVVVVFWQNENGLFYSQEAGVCPLEQALLIQHKNMQRFVDIGHSTIINYPNISLLINNMPVDNAVLYGRYKDLFPHILEITNEKVAAIHIKQHHAQENVKLTAMLNEINTLVNKHNTLHISSINKLTTQLAGLQQPIAAAKDTASLGALNNSVNELQQTLHAVSATTNNLAVIKQQLEHVIAKHHNLLNSLQSEEQTKATNIQSENNSIELF